MNDLEKFKAVWEQVNEDESIVPDFSETDQIIRKRSRNVIFRFRVSLLIELWGSIFVLAGLTLFYLFYPTQQYSFYLVAIAAMLLVCVAYYYRQYQNLKFLEPSFDAGVKDSIIRILKWMNRFVLMYLKLNQVILAFCIMVFFIIRLDVYIVKYPVISDTPRGFVLLALVLLSVIATLLFYPIQRLYIRWMFGRYMDRLRDNLQELRDVGEE